MFFRRTRRRKTRFHGESCFPPSADGGTLRGSCSMVSNRRNILYRQSDAARSTGSVPRPLVKERQFSKHEDWRFIPLNRAKNHDIGSKIRSIPLPNSNLFEIHGSIFKPFTARRKPGPDLGGAYTAWRAFFCISKNTHYGLFSWHRVPCHVRFSQMFDQIEIFLPDMSCTGFG